MKDIFSEIWSTARRNKLRTALTGFSVAWGIFMLIFLLGAGNGLIHSSEQNNDRFLANSVRVGSWMTEKPYRGLKEGRYITLKERDRTTTVEEFSGNVGDVGATLSQNVGTIGYGKEYVSASLMGVYPEYQKINKREMLHGRFINANDIREERKTLVVSEDQAKELMPKDISLLLGKFVNVGGIAFKVVGIYKGNKYERNSDVLTAYTTLKTMYGKGDEVGNIEFTIHGLPTLQDNERFEDKYIRRLNANHDIAPDDRGGIWVWNRYSDNLQMSTALGILRMALWIVGLFTLLSGIVGVSNIMLITVKERTREFGVRKAIGAKPWSILKLIIIESIITTTIFGYIGMFLGICVNEYMDATLGHETVDLGVFKQTFFVDPTVGLDVCIEATAVMIIAGTIAGLIPAIKAARIRPIEALRAE